MPKTVISMPPVVRAEAQSGARTLADWASLSVEDALAALGATSGGLSGQTAAERLSTEGPNSIGAHRAHPLAILGRQFKNAVLILLLATSAVAFALGDRNDAVIVLIILTASIALGFVNEYRAERQSSALRDALPHRAIVIRDGQQRSIDVTEVVRGDIVRLTLGSMVPADIRLLSAIELECNESVLTGESAASAKSQGAVAPGRSLADLDSCALMGTVVSSGSGTGVVVATGARSAFGQIAAGLNARAPETGFQLGLQRFSVLLLWVAVTLSALIIVTGLLLHRSIVETLLFALAIAVGVTPQLLPAIVTSSLAAGSRDLARERILVKRLVSIEDLGNVSILVTDKTGTLTLGTLQLLGAMDPFGAESKEVLQLAVQAVDTGGSSDHAVGANEIDQCLIELPGRAPAGRPVVEATLPFDHERRISSVLVKFPQGERLLIAKGAPEAILDRCRALRDAAKSTMAAQFAAGNRLIAVATRPIEAGQVLVPELEQNLELRGFVAFSDPARPDAAAELARLRMLGIAVLIATGDNLTVAQQLTASLGLPAGGTVTGDFIDALPDTELVSALQNGGIAARISPEQKSRIVRVLRGEGRTVAFLGDGVNDALALHEADVGISVMSATDVARDAADVVLLDKSLGAVASGVASGRRIFGNTIKYVLMGTSSNFGNMMSAAAASTFLTFLPMLPGQVLLNNLLYDTSQLALSTDNVDPEQTRRPAHWDMRLIRRFMLVFGPASSLFDFITFALLLGVLHAGPDLFRTGWFVESITTQTLVVFIIRTRRVPFVRSRPSWQLTVSTLAVVAAGWIIPFTPVGAFFGLVPLSPLVLVGILVLTLVYVVLIDTVKAFFFRAHVTAPPTPRPRIARIRRASSRYARARKTAH